MPATTTDRCKKCLAPYIPDESAFAKSQACDCDDPHIARKLKLSPGLFDFIFRAVIDKGQS
jgi:hypothetical protein